MKINLIKILLVVLLTNIASGATIAQSRILHLTLQTRDSNTQLPIHTHQAVATSKVAIIIVDPWNYHWCMTACERVAAMIPRWNKAIAAARKMGMEIIWCPSDVIGSYSGYLQRERVLALPLMAVPRVRENPLVKFTCESGDCMCGPGISCLLNYGWDGMNPQLKLAEDDFIASSTEEVYALLMNHGITHVIYMGLHTNICLYGKPGALQYMWQAGLNCMVARDINDAFTHYDPATGFTLDKGTQQTDEDIERSGIPTINVGEEWVKAGVWTSQSIVETVRITPWGKRDRPYFFNGSEAVTLTAPWLKDVEIRYTLDGSQPDNHSAKYKAPLQIRATTRLHTAAFRAGKLVSIPTDAFFVMLPPEPPKPDIYLDDLDYITDPYGDKDPVYKACLWLPKKEKSYDDQPLRMRQKLYKKGLGFRAPSSVRYALNPAYKRFVAKVGIDDNLIRIENGRNLAMHCSVVFRVFIDGSLAAESPVMRISQEPWRFDVKIPSGSRYINLVCMDAGTRNILDLGNWVDAGFLTQL